MTQAQIDNRLVSVLYNVHMLALTELHQKWDLQYRKKYIGITPKDEKSCSVTDFDAVRKPQIWAPSYIFIPPGIVSNGKPSE